MDGLQSAGVSAAWWYFTRYSEGKREDVINIFTDVRTYENVAGGLMLGYTLGLTEVSQTSSLSGGFYRVRKHG